MKFKVDQNLPADFVQILSQAGHDALTVWQEDLGGAPSACRREECAAFPERVWKSRLQTGLRRCTQQNKGIAPFRKSW
jgi:hypothetical protein